VRGLHLATIAALVLFGCQGGAMQETGKDASGRADVQTLHFDASSRDGALADGSTDGGALDADLTQDAAIIDASSLDASPLDAMSTDSGTVAQSGAVIVTEYLATPTAAGLEWIELYNAGTSSVRITDLTVTIDSHAALGAQPIHAPSDPSGAMGTSVMLAPGAYAYGPANPSTASSIPQDAAFVFGSPGVYQGDALAGTGDAVTISGASGAIDRVDFRGSITDPARPLGAQDFPLIAGASTSLDPGQLSASANDSGAAWCADPFRGPTPGHANLGCGAMVISEVLYEYASLTSTVDAQRQFIELAGPAGGPLANVVLARIQGAGPNAGQVQQQYSITAARMPLSGLYVVADDGGTGTTQVPNANQLATLSLAHGPNAIQLVRADPASRPVLLDAFGYGAVSAGLVDSARSLPAVEGMAVSSIVPVVHPVAWARADNEANTMSNASDFRYAPSPTPGARNGSHAFAVTTIEPDNAIATHTATVVIRGSDFSDAMTSSFGASQARSCVFIDPDAMRCILPYSGSGSAQQVDVTVATRPEEGAQTTLRSAFTWTTSADGTGSASECDYCNLQFPSTITVSAGTATANIYGRIYWAGHTDTTMSAASGVMAELGYGPTGTDPSRSNAWTWVVAVFNVKAGVNNHDDEYRGTLTVSTHGMYSYTYRFSIDGGLTWNYTDLDAVGKILGPTSYNWMNLGVLTVN
jgi:hypothetical protein